MKVKNIAFSGFAAAILAGVGAAQAASVQIVSPDYVTRAIAGKQDALVAGDGITIAADGKTISADMTDATVTIGGEDVSVSQALTDIATDTATAKSDASTAKSNAATAVDTASTAKDTADAAKEAATAAGTAAAEAKSDAASAVSTANTASQTAAAANTTAGEAKSAATAAGTAAQTAQNEVDALELVVAGKAAQSDLTALTSRVATNEDAIADINEELDKMATSETVTDLQTRMTTAEGEIDGLRGSVNTLDGDVNTNGSVKKQIADAIASEVSRSNGAYAAKSYEARVAANETAISTNTANIATNAEDITELKNAGYIPAPSGDGLWLADVNDGTVSWSQVEILTQP